MGASKPGGWEKRKIRKEESAKTSSDLQSKMKIQRMRYSSTAYCILGSQRW